MRSIDEYEYQVDNRLGGKYYCRIYRHGIPGPIAFTDDFDTGEEAINAAEKIVQGLQKITYDS